MTETLVKSQRFLGFLYFSSQVYVLRKRHRICQVNLNCIYIYFLSEQPQYYIVSLTVRTSQKSNGQSIEPWSTPY